MAKKEERSKKQDLAKDEKIHTQKHDEPKLQTEKNREAGKESTQGTGMWNADEKDLGKVKGKDTGDYNEKSMGAARGRGMENANQPGLEDAGETNLGNTDGTGVGNFDGIDISNFDPSSGLGKKVAGKGCLSTIVGIIVVLALIMIF